MNRRRFLRQTAKVAAGFVAATSVPVSATKMIPVAGLSRPETVIRDVAIWHDVNIPISDLTGYASIGRSILKDWSPDDDRRVALLIHQMACNERRRTS